MTKSTALQDHQLGVLFFTCSNLGTYENNQYFVHLLIWKFYSVQNKLKINLFNIENMKQDKS
jgi:hypothetical protein